jgi:6-pyruvoyltetrahydropterin/6-carboxytetrahydropterin synthase
MLRLTREVRFAVHTDAKTDEKQLASTATNSFAGYPSLTGLGHWFAMQVTVEGEADPASNYLLNIKNIDQKAREIAIPLVGRAVRDGTFGGGAGVVLQAFAAMRDAWGNVMLAGIRLAMSPFLAIEARAEEIPMVRLSQKFEFSASHRLHNPAMSDEANRATYGKCNNPHGHGHNYELQVTVAGEADETGVLVDVPAFEKIVAETVIDRFDHRNLNTEVPEFKDLIPSVENIAKVIYGLLKGKVGGKRAKLASVTVWETPKTWCEYAE